MINEFQEKLEHEYDSDLQGAFEDIYSTYATTKEKTFVNYEYIKTHGTTNKWELRRPKNKFWATYYFKTNETAKNKSHITKFKGYVDQIDSLEKKIIGGVGVAGLSALAAGAAGAGAIFTGGTLTQAAWAAILTSAGFGTKVLNNCLAFDRACKNAYDKYYDVYYSSTVYY